MRWPPDRSPVPTDAKPGYRSRHATACARANSWSGGSLADHPGSEDVTGTAHGLDQHRTGVCVFDLLAQPADLHIDGAIERRIVAITAAIKQANALQHFARVLHERPTKFELARAELDLTPDRKSTRLNSSH